MQALALGQSHAGSVSEGIGELTTIAVAEYALPACPDRGLVILLDDRKGFIGDPDKVLAPALGSKVPIAEAKLPAVEVDARRGEPRDLALAVWLEEGEAEDVPHP